ncbi:TIGR03862 family flavoprotein [uncultured Nitrospira sp.]|uniref:TIGR03862 family flavoprotein n=1 Tax=uncultured Nitrospira sp. TaxID=157176 RepID=UPI0031409A03
MKVAVMGGGPAGLMAAEAAIAMGARVDLYDAMASVGRKFLLAGKGGLNLTHSEPFEKFILRYGSRQGQIQSLLAEFGPDALRKWARELGVETFIGTSGRVFPTDLKSAPLLRAWLRRLRQHGLAIHVRHRWDGWNETGALRFATPKGDRLVSADAVVLALGGGSWSRFGSDGAWVPLLAGRGVSIEPLKPANCGFDVDWSPHLRGRYAGHPVKPVVVAGITPEGIEFRQQGEFVVTETGIEGGVIYAISAWIRDEIGKTGTALLRLDLAPDRDASRLISDLSRPRGSRSMASHLQRRVGISGVKAGLLREYVPKKDFADPVLLGTAIKSLPVRLVAPRPLEEAISTAGGVPFEVLDGQLMIRILPGVFCAGEMLDWEAPTGGYLLTACFASGHAAGVGAARWLQSARDST